jgi:hypothetical protein
MGAGDREALSGIGSILTRQADALLSLAGDLDPEGED